VVIKDIKMEKDDEYFSIQVENVIINSPLPFDIFINSASGSGRIHYIKTFGIGRSISKEELFEIKKKYFQIYLKEDQRENYLNSLMENKNVSKEKKTEVIKDCAIKYLGEVFNPKREFSTEILEETIVGCKKTVENMVTVISDLKLTDLQKLIGSLSFHDFYTFDHSINVSMYTILILKEIDPKVSKDDLVIAGLGGMLHDIGKTKLPLKIINKAGKLEDNEFKEIMTHPQRGKDLMESQHLKLEGVNFEKIINIIYQHHENFNGTGYPLKLSGEQIDKFARIVAIADFFDAITTHRSYHQALGLNDALSVMKNTCGKKIDPALFDAFKNTVKDIGLGKSWLYLPDEYDPCQPQNTLPFVHQEAKKKDVDIFGKKEEKKIGKIKKVA
jgi:HD-GYP domain-containing protein (c-di-GMP phosphodiesterase class II)